ncbi:MAG: family 10 glycosylhydrolase [Pedobacter sp.]|nr:family 10 glycosylhydrolase [Pedobacter sp.]
MKYYILSFAFAIILSTFSCKKEIQRLPIIPIKKEIHFAGTWVTNVASDALDSRENIKKTVATCKSSGINNIFVVVWNQGRTLFPSDVMQNTFGEKIMAKYVGRDPLQEMIEEAHKENIKVHAWFEYGFAASNNQNGGLIIQTKPSWAAKDIDGNLLKKNGFEWMNAFMPEVQDFMISLVMEVVNKYDVDGVQGDDRMPALPSTGGYDTYTVNLYKSQNNGNLPPTDYKNAAWLTWRANLLTDFLVRLYQQVKAKKPNVMVTTAPSVHPFAKDEYLQDWPTWLDRGVTDLVLPQHYRYDIAAYKSTLAQQLSYVKAKDKNKFYPGVLIQNAAYNPPLDFMTEMVNENRRNGIAGESFWFFEGVKKFPTYFEVYNK